MLPDTPFIHCTHSVRAGGVAYVWLLMRAGVPKETAYAMPCRDVHDMVLLLARSGQWAKGERTLVAELPNRPLPTPSWLSMHVRGALSAALVVVFVTLLYAAIQLAS